jgi:hypothetical protein
MARYSYASASLLSYQTIGKVRLVTGFVVFVHNHDIKSRSECSWQKECKNALRETA